MVFENGVKNIQAAAYNGARTVNVSGKILIYLILVSPVLTYKRNQCQTDSKISYLVLKS